MDDLIQVLRDHECPDSTFVDADPALVFHKANGSVIYDTVGKSYIDLCSGFGVMAFGHNHKDQRDLFSEQLVDTPPIVHGMGDVYPSDSKIHLIKDLVAAMPDHINRAALALSGSQAVEIALKTALLRRPKGDFISFSGSYHGVDLGVLPVTSRQDFKEPFQSWLPENRAHELPYNCSEEQLEKLLKNIPSGLAGIIVEPIQGRAGVHLPEPGWLAMLKDMSLKYDGLLIFDEVFTGLGRIGSMSTSFEVAADLVCLGKALGGGFPLSACCGTEQAFQSWPQSTGEAIHTGTFFGHPMSCKMGSRVIERLTTTAVIEESCTLGKELLDFLKNTIGDLSAVSEIRGQGLMIAIEFTVDGAGANMMNQLRSDGVITLASGDKGQSLTMSPALNIKKDLLWEALDKIIHLTKKL